MRKYSAALLTVYAIAMSFLPAAAQDAQQKIVYARSVGEVDAPETSEIHLMDPDGSDSARLTNNSREDAYPVLSPDGGRIAFSREMRGQYDLFVMGSDGSDVVRVTRTRNGDEVLPSWSPDGKWLAFTATTAIPDGPSQSEIYKIRLSNGRFARLTFTPKTKEFAPDWAPDGTEIAFTKQNYRRGKYGVASVRPDAEGLRWIVVNPRSGDGYTDANPSWSPDSQWLTFSRDHGDDAYVDIYKVRRDGTEAQPVTQLFELAENPVWGADGRILFMHDEAIAGVPSAGGEIEHLTPTRTGLPYWRPDW
ncbi:MAG: hypothetical protein ACRDLB_09460 [Actinomycetota bacterium]